MPQRRDEQQEGQKVGEESRHHQENSRDPADGKGGGALISERPQEEAHREEKQHARASDATPDVEEKKDLDKREQKYKKDEGAEKSHRDGLGRSRDVNEKLKTRSYVDSGEIVNPVHTLIPKF